MQNTFYTKHRISPHFLQFDIYTITPYTLSREKIMKTAKRTYLLLDRIDYLLEHSHLISDIEAQHAHTLMSNSKAVAHATPRVCQWHRAFLDGYTAALRENEKALDRIAKTVSG